MNFTLNSASPRVNISPNTRIVLCRHSIRGTLCTQSLGEEQRCSCCAIQAPSQHTETQFRAVELCSHSQGRCAIPVIHSRNTSIVHLWQRGFEELRMDSAWEEADGHKNGIEGKLFLNSSAQFAHEERGFLNADCWNNLTENGIKVYKWYIWVKLCIPLRCIWTLWVPPEFFIFTLDFV